MSEIRRIVTERVGPRPTGLDEDMKDPSRMPVREPGYKVASRWAREDIR